MNIDSTIIRRRHRTIVLTLTIALIGRAAMMILLPLTDPSEGRYGQIAANMARSHDWVTPSLVFNGMSEPFLGKPPLFFWLAAASAKLFNTSAFSVRLPSLLTTGAVVWLIVTIVGEYIGRRQAYIASAITVSSILTFALSGAALVDAVLAASVAGAIMAYYAFSREPDRQRQRYWSLTVFALLACGFMTKGPVAIAMFGLPIFTWTLYYRKWSLLRHHAWVAGFAIFALLTVPWFYIAEVRNPGLIRYFFINENLLRFITPDYGDRYGSGHIYPRGSAIVMMFLATSPWSIYAVWTICRKKNRRNPTVNIPDVETRNFFLLGFVMNTLFWCGARQLLITYMLPMVPLFAIWLAIRVPPQSHRRMCNASTLIVAAYLFIGACILPHARLESSTRAILQRARTVAQPLTTRPDFLFLRRTPNSAYFYGHNSIVTHPKESPDQSIQRALSRGRDCIVVARSRYLAQVQSSLIDKMVVLDTYGQWTILAAQPTQ